MNKPEGAAEQGCEHEWTDYGVLTSGDNPKLEIETCVRCGVHRKKQPAGAAEWTTTAQQDGDCAIVRGTALIGVGCTAQQTLNIVAAHNAAIDKERNAAHDHWIATVSRTNDQLAAEREKRQLAERCWQRSEEQLAAAVEALERVRFKLSDRNLTDILDRALAAVKEGK